jgi:heme-degrading monooxygenase HmoA
MKPFTAPSVSALLLIASNIGCHSPAPGETSPKTPAQDAPFTIDLQAHPDLQFRIDAFAVPASARAEFERAMDRNLAFIKTLPGYMSHLVFEKTSGPTTFDIVTIAVWESPEAVAAAGERVRAYYQSIGFDLPAQLARLGITASLGNYHASVPRN